MIVINITMKLNKFLFPFPWGGIKIMPITFVSYIVYKLLCVNCIFEDPIQDTACTLPVGSRMTLVVVLQLQGQWCQC